MAADVENLQYDCYRPVALKNDSKFSHRRELHQHSNPKFGCQFIRNYIKIDTFLTIAQTILNYVLGFNYACITYSDL